MHKAILVFALSLNTQNNAICAVSLVRGFVEKRLLSNLKNTSNGYHGNQNVSSDQALDKLSEKLHSRLLVQEENVFKRGHILPPGHRGSKTKPGLDRVKVAQDEWIHLKC